MSNERITKLRGLLAQTSPAGTPDRWMSPDILPLLPPPVGAERNVVPPADGTPTITSYRFSEPHKRAIQVALLLRQPLLITGEAGVGKTRSARALADLLGVRYERFNIKSTTTGRDLLYSFDDVARFRDAATARTSGSAFHMPGLVRYVELSALGKAIARSAGPKAGITTDLPVKDLLGPAAARLQGDLTLGDLFPRVFDGKEPSHTLVLVDELDKAPRDTPNDLLAEFEEMQFKIPELGYLEIKANESFWPILVITSNSERSLPDPFLRRCVFHHLKLDEEALSEIVLTQLPDLQGDPALPLVVSLFQDIRRNLAGLQKVPSTGELVGAAALLRAWPRQDRQAPDIRDSELQRALAGVLGKIKDDVDVLAPRIAEWAAKQPSGAAQ
jgi:MoxR-like ATPase